MMRFPYLRYNKVLNRSIETDEKQLDLAFLASIAEIKLHPVIWASFLSLCDCAALRSVSVRAVDAFLPWGLSQLLTNR